MNNYDDNDQNVQLQIEHKSSPIQAYYNNVKSLLGIGIIALPHVSANNGYFYTFILLIILAYVSTQSNLLLIAVADHRNKKNTYYNDVLKISLGGKWPLIVDFILVISQLGVCIAYLIMLTSSLENTLPNVNIHITKISIYGLSLIIIIPLSFLKKMHFFHRYSYYGFVLACITILIVFVDCAFFLNSAQRTPQQPIYFNWKNTFHFLGIAMYGFDAAYSVLPIRESMKNPQLFKQIPFYSILSAFILALFLSEITTYSYGDLLLDKDIILFTIINPYLQVSALLCYALSLLISYPLSLLPAVMIIEDVVNKRNYYSVIQAEEFEEESIFVEEYITSDPIEITIRLILMIVIYFVAYQIPSFALFLNLLGSMFSSLLLFIFPVFAHYYYFKNRNISNNINQPIFKYILILLIGLMALILGTITSIQALFEQQK